MGTYTATIAKGFTTGVNPLNLQLPFDEHPAEFGSYSAWSSYLSSVSLKGTVSTTGTITFSLCDTSGNNSVLLGSVTLNAGSRSFTLQANKNLNATSLEGKALAIKITGNITITANASIRIITGYKYTLSVESNEHADNITALIPTGSSYPTNTSNSGNYTLVEGSSASAKVGTLIRFGATPEVGYKRDSYSATVNGVPLDTIEYEGGSYPHAFYMPEGNVLISYVFSLEDFPISTEASPCNFSGAVTAPATAQYNDTVALSYAELPGLEFDHYTLSYCPYSASNPNSRHITELTENTFSMPAMKSETSLLITAYYNVTEHLIIWDNVSLSLLQNGRLLKATLNGSALDNTGEEVEYWLYRGTEEVAKFYGNQAVISLSDGDYGSNVTYSIVAKSSIESTGPSSSITCVIPVYANAGYYDGTGYLGGDTYYYNGSDWVRVEMRYYDGSQWNNVITN